MRVINVFKHFVEVHPNTWVYNQSSNIADVLISNDDKAIGCMELRPFQCRPVIQLDKLEFPEERRKIASPKILMERLVTKKILAGWEPVAPISLEEESGNTELHIRITESTNIQIENMEGVESGNIVPILPVAPSIYFVNNTTGENRVVMLPWHDLLEDRYLFRKLIVGPNVSTTIHQETLFAWGDRYRIPRVSVDACDNCHGNMNIVLDGIAVPVPLISKVSGEAVTEVDADEEVYIVGGELKWKSC